MTRKDRKALEAELRRIERTLPAIKSKKLRADLWADYRFIVGTLASLKVVNRIERRMAR